MLYTGVTNDLRRRVYVHRHKLLKGYTSHYKLRMLVYYEVTSDIRAAIGREKQIKGWLRKKKVALIESFNPRWLDLGAEFVAETDSARAPGMPGNDDKEHSGAKILRWRSE